MNRGPVPQKLYGVIGDPIGHSLSPLLHNAAFRAWGIPAALFAWHITPEKLPAFIQAVRTLPITGACVTIPHKEAIIPFLDRLTPLAARVGAVNTLYWDNGELVGHNTDAEAFLAPLYTRPPFPSVLLLGAGGAARAALSGLLSLPGVERIFVAARRKEQADALIRSVQPAEAPSQSATAPPFFPGAAEPSSFPDAVPPAPSLGPGRVTVSFLPWEQRHHAEADLVVNTTPVGLNEGASPLVFHSADPAGPKIPACHDEAARRQPGRKLRLAYDVIYRDTPFLAEARAAGWEALNGRDMFVAQAQAQFILWTGFALPDSAVRELDAAIT